MLGVYGMVLGFLKLGFLLDFVSIPIITGFISAVAITIILNQMGALLGSEVSSNGAAQQIHDVFANLPGASGLTCAMGFTCILFLTILEKAGKRWGDKNKIIWTLSITRSFLALVLYTGISYAVNHERDPDDYLFAVVKVKSDGQQAPVMPSGDLIRKVAIKSITVFIGAAIEHTGIARAFGIKNDYVPDQSQELCYFGVCNFVNSFVSHHNISVKLTVSLPQTSPRRCLLTEDVVVPCHGSWRCYVENVCELHVQGQVTALRLCHNGRHPRLHLRARWHSVLDPQGYTCSYHHLCCVALDILALGLSPVLENIPF